MSNNVQYAFHFDQSKCNGCKACHVICKSKFDAEEGRIPRRVYEYVGGSCSQDANGVMRNNVFAYYTSVGCNHCSEPVCVKACPTGAMHKRKSDGLVHVDAGVCIGCESCARACPYDAPQIDRTRKVMTKCTGCPEQLAKGKKPLCVAGCTQRALDFGTVEEIQARYPSAERANVAPLPAPNVTTPNLFITKSRISRPSGSTEGKVENWQEV